MWRKGVYCIVKKRRRSGSPNQVFERLRRLSEERQGDQRPIQAALACRLAIFAMIFRLHRVAACTALQLGQRLALKCSRRCAEHHGLRPCRINVPFTETRKLDLNIARFACLSAHRRPEISARVREGQKTMGAPKAQKSISESNEAHEIQTMDGTLRFPSENALETYTGTNAEQIDTVAKQAPDFFGGNEMGDEKVPTEWLDDLLAVGSRSVEEIDDLIKQLQDARDYLLAEGERVRLVNARYSHLAQAASASAKIITDSIGKWRDLGHAHSQIQSTTSKSSLDRA
jgi:hypothetical protein